MADGVSYQETPLSLDLIAFQGYGQSLPITLPILSRPAQTAAADVRP